MTSTGPRKRSREMIVTHVRGHDQGFPRSLLSGILSSHGASAVARVSERQCCLLVLNLVSSTLSCIRRPRPRLRVLDVRGSV